MKQIAIYGKGGIGKSTLAANISMAMAQSSLKVLQIGCDPKHDSTRLLLGGEGQETVLHQMKSLRPEELRLEDILRVGAGGVHCVEAGGPEPGVGCAGRGIISMDKAVEVVGLDKRAYDVVLYDVLGDVVCGGFAVPMRDGYADEVYVVTSGEVMALYAANNICKGLLNFGGKKGKLGGIIGNGRGVEREEELLRAFAERMGTRLLAYIPRNPLFREAEAQRKTVMAYAPDSPVAAIFKSLAALIAKADQPTVPQPMAEEEFEAFLAGFFQGSSAPLEEKTKKQTLAVRDPESEIRETPRLWKQYLSPEKARPSDGPSSKDEFLSKAMREKAPLHSCALAGAFSVTNQVLNSVTVMHSPAGCAHTSLSASWLAGMSAAVRGLPVPPSEAMPSLLCTNMTERDMVFGGERGLGALLEEVNARQHPDAFFIITSCPSAIIGDDPKRVIEQLQPACRVVPIDSDGIMGGDYTQGMINAYRNVAEAFVDERITPERGLVNIIGESPIANVTDVNYHFLQEAIARLGGRIHCRFLRHARIDEIATLKRASLNILANFDAPCLTVRRYLEQRFTLPFFDEPWPVGFAASERWILHLGEILGQPETARAYLEEKGQTYAELCEGLRVHFRGVRVLIAAYEGQVDWVAESLTDLGAEVIKIGLFESCQNEFLPCSALAVPVEADYSAEKRFRDIEELRPDLVLTNYVPRQVPAGIGVTSLPLQPQAGFFGPLAHAQRWVLALYPFVEGWRQDYEGLKDTSPA